MIRAKRLVGALCVCALSLAAVEAQSGKELGKPFITNYSPRDYGAHPQNWAIVQDDRGVMYFGNGNSVLEYDGVSWRQIFLTNRSTGRSLTKADDGRIYVGGVGELGYLAPDSSGRMEYVSLLQRVAEADRNFSDVWQVHATPDGVYFNTTDRLFLWTGDEMRVWPAKFEYHMSFYVNDVYYVRQWQVGLMRMEGDSLTLVPGGERFANERIYVMLPFDENRVLLVTRTRGLYLYDGKTFQPFKTEADGFLKESLIYQPGAVLPGGRFALGTIGGGAIIIDRQGHLLQTINRESGLQDLTVLFVYADRQNTLWLGLDTGIARVETSSPLTRFDAQSGLSSAVYSIERHDGKLYVGTSIGASVFDPASSSFRPISGVGTQCFDLLSVDGTLLTADFDGVHRIEGRQAYVVRRSVGNDYNALTLHRYRKDPRYVFVATSRGVGVLRRDEASGRWVDDGRIPGVPEQSVYAMAESPDGSLWLAGTVRGIFHVTFAPGENGRPSWQNPQIERFGTSEGVPEGGTGVFSAKGRIYFGTLDGIYRLDEEQRRLIPDTTFNVVSLGGEPSLYTLKTDYRGQVWINFGRETALAVPQAGGGYKIDKAPFRPFADVAINEIFPERDGIVWFGGTEGLIRYDSNVHKDYAADFSALIRHAIAGDDSLIYGGAQPLAGREASRPHLPFSLNALHFEFAAPYFEQENKTLYQTYLEGFDRDWSNWSRKVEKEYTNLAEGDYHFHVRAKNIFEHVSRGAVFNFTILAPWYRSWLAYLIYVLAAGGLVFGLVGLRTRQLRARSRELEQTVHERTAELQQRLEELAVINSVQEGLVRELDIHAIYDLIGDKIRDMFDAQAVLIATFDHEAGVEHFKYVIEKGERFYPDPRPFEGVRKHLIDTRETVLINDHAEEAVQKYGMRVIPGTELPKSLLFVPLVVGEAVKGYVSLQNIDREHAFSDSDVRLLTTLANSMSVALENARLFDETNRLLEESRERAAELAIINSVGEGLAKQLDFQAIIDLVGDKITEVFDAQVVTISLCTRQDGMVHHRYAIERGKRFPEIEQKAVPMDPNRREIIQTRVPLVFGTAEEIIAHSGQDVLAGEMPKSFMGVPIVLGAEVTGVITVQDIDREHLFAESDVRLLMTLASNMGVALENARLFAETTQRATELATVNNISKAIVSKLDLDALILLVGEQMRQLFRANIVYFAMFDKDTGMIHFPYVYGDTLSPIKLGKGWASRIIQTNEPLLINKDLAEVHAQMGVATVGTPAASYLGVPVAAGDEVRGVISVQSTEQENRFDENDMRLLSTIAANVGVALQNADAYRQLNATVGELNRALENLKATQEQLVTQEKLASLGALTAGIAHEIKNPLNFVNNFAELSVELLQELREDLQKQREKLGPAAAENFEEILTDLEQNARKINEHGKRADSIVRGMLQHSRGKAGEHEATDLNALLDEYLNLAYHGMRAQNSAFNVTIEKEYDESIGELDIVPQDISRVFLNIISNGFYEVHKKATQRGDGYSPTLSVRSRDLGDAIEIRIRDNGNGIPEGVRDKLFNPFFTTKPTGQGTGLGLSLSYDIIVKEHHGSIRFETATGEYTEFIINLPKNGNRKG